MCLFTHLYKKNICIKKDKKVRKELDRIVSLYGADLQYYDFDQKHFGNTVVRLKSKTGIYYEFTLDRGTIEINNRTVVPFRLIDTYLDGCGNRIEPIMVLMLIIEKTLKQDY